MLIAVLVLAFVAFVAFVNYILSGAMWSLVLVFLAVGAGVVLFILDTASKASKAKKTSTQVEPGRLHRPAEAVDREAAARREQDSNGPAA